MILAERAARLSAEAEAKAESTNADAMIAHLRLEMSTPEQFPSSAAE
jgi:hypothetical protein